MTILDITPYVVGTSTLKACPHCREVKPRDAFRVNRRSPSGLSSWCKECMKARYYASPEEARRKSREWYASNKEHVSTRSKAYRQAHIDEIRENGRNYRRENALHIAEFQREYRRAHRDEISLYRKLNADRIRAKEREYQETHKTEIAAYRAEYREVYFQSERGKSAKAAAEHRRRARKAGAGGTFNRRDVEALRAGQTDSKGRVRCWWCGSVIAKWHIDHRIPLARGGSSNPSNLCLSCPECNLNKRAKLPSEWIARLL